MAFGDPGVGRSILDSGRGTEPQTVTLAEACEVGDVLGYSSGWKLALATVGTAIQGRVVALKAGEIADEVPVSANPVVGGYTGATPGGYVYVAEGTDSGEITQTAPNTSGDCDVIIGIALSATEVMFFLNSRLDHVVP